MLTRTLFLLMMCLNCFTGLQADDKLYIDEDDFTATGNALHIHVGNNVWLETDTIHRDCSGLFTYEYNLNRSMSAVKMEYERTWRCPYCYNYWPIGKPCGKLDCPSKYK